VAHRFFHLLLHLIFRSPDQLIGSYVVTVLMTLIGTSIGLFIISMTGYALQRKDFPFRNGISFYIYFTSLSPRAWCRFYYLIVKVYGLKDTYWAVLLPLLMSPWLIILMKNYVKAIPHEITESGKIDGAGDFRIFWSLIVPSMTPALATIGLFLALGYWNEWYYSSLFLGSQVVYRPLQYQLYNIINKVASLKLAGRRQHRAQRPAQRNAQNGDRHPGHRADYPVVPLRAEVLRGGPHGRRREGLKRFQRRSLRRKKYRQ
jgi:ABC-type glycerol-3-phosphate transport system permease component